MSVKVYAIRHGKKESIPEAGTTSWGLSAHLTEAGIGVAKRAAQRLLTSGEKFTRFATSPLVRAQETLFTAMEELGIKPRDFDGVVTYERGLWADVPGIWYDECDPADYSNEHIFAQWPTGVINEGERVLDTIRGIADEVEDGSALCVSHGGPLDAAIMVARKILGGDFAIGDVKEGCGAVFHFEAGELIGVDDFVL